MNALNAGSLGLKFHSRRSPSSHHVWIFLRPCRQFLSLLQKFPTAKCLLWSIPRLPTPQILKHLLYTGTVPDPLFFPLSSVRTPQLSKYFQIYFTTKETWPYPHWFQSTPRGYHGSSHLNTSQYHTWSHETTCLWQIQKVTGETWTQVKPFLHQNQLWGRTKCELSKRNWPSQKILAEPQLCARQREEQQGTLIMNTWFPLSKTTWTHGGDLQGQMQHCHSEKGLVPGTLRRLVSDGGTRSPDSSRSWNVRGTKRLVHAWSSQHRGLIPGWIFQCGSSRKRQEV